MKQFGTFFLIAFFAIIPFAQATEIEEITSSKGITGWLVEDHKLPLIAINFAFRGGVEQDPTDKQGLATLTTSLLTQGAGPLDAAAYQKQLAEHSVFIHFNAGRDELTGSLKALRDERQTAFELLHLALTQPHFDRIELQRARDRQLTHVRFQMGDPDWQARYALLHQVFADHPYAQRSLGSVKSLAALTAEDIKGFARDHLARDNLVVAVAGDITPDELKSMLDEVFGDLPEKAKLKDLQDVVWPKAKATILVPREGTQTDLLFARPGPKRSDPDWYAVEIANYILGGGGFSSRLMQEVRDKNGLTYGISTDNAPMEHAAMIAGNAATLNLKTGKAWDITLDVWRTFFDKGAKLEEISAAKDYLTGSLPLTMTSTDAIAAVLVEIQLEHLGRDYLQKRDQYIRDVTPDDLKAAIKKWFDPSQISLVMVGKPDGITPTKILEQVRD